MHTPLQLQKIIEDAIPQLAYPAQPANLYEPIKYIMSLGGKRIRPVMVLMASELFTDEVSRALNVALAIETFHNFTLVHDDIMDNAPLRRGKQTVHEKWGVNNAILSGDVMMVESNKHLSKVDISVLKPVLDTFNRTAQGVCEGQQLDMEFETRPDVSIAEYIEMIRLKTAVLLGGAMKLGAIVGGADDEDADLLYQFGENLGVAFQLQDDILDVYGDPEKFGKQVGGDIIANKKTFLLINTLELANESQRKEMEALMQLPTTESASKVDAVKKIYDELQIKQLTEKEMDSYASSAFTALDKIKVGSEKKQQLKALATQILNRNS
jgi:geranylgeranyl diphosphate synthase type II